MAFIAGCNGRVHFGGLGVTLQARRWSVNMKTDEHDVTNFENDVSDNVAAGSRCFADYIGGVREAEITVEALYDSTVDPFDNPPEFFPAIVYDTFKLIPNISDINSFWDFPFVLLTSISMDCEVRGVVTYNLTLKSKGKFIWNPNN